jgi:serine protease
MISLAFLPEILNFTTSLILYSFITPCSTHVAGTACGQNYGVASNCVICPVQILSSNGSGSNSGVISGINFVVGKCKGASFRCVINMSIGGGFDSTLNSAVSGAVDNGVVVVVAAGNDGKDACSYSPSSATKAITVGSTTSTDAKSSFSNIGSCVDVYAPGSSIISASRSSDTATTTMSGTSMASPRKFASFAIQCYLRMS